MIVRLQHELAEAYWKVGNIQGKPSLPNLGDTAGAIASYRKAQAIFESLLAKNPTDRTVQRDLAFTYQYLGHVLGEKTRDLTGNLENQRKAVIIFETLALADPGNSEYQLNLVKGYNYLATATADRAQSQSNLSMNMEMRCKIIAGPLPLPKNYQSPIRQIESSNAKLPRVISALATLCVWLAI